MMPWYDNTWYLSQDWSAQLIEATLTNGDQSLIFSAKFFQIGANLKIGRREMKI